MLFVVVELERDDGVLLVEGEEEEERGEGERCGWKVVVAPASYDTTSIISSSAREGGK